MQDTSKNEFRWIFSPVVTDQVHALFDTGNKANRFSTHVNFYKLLPIRWPIPGASDEFDEQLQKNNVDLEDYNKRFSTEKSRLEFILFHAKKFIRKNWIDTVRLVVVPVCSVIYVRLTGNEPKNPYDVLLSCDRFLLTILLHAVFFRWLQNHLAELRGEE
ncbi:hypothetical protein CAEBREN_10189 [Caenorhabditis brenneri]|uniref:Uncharacterized protein n=1 Tax=Caenorhabditis brenneri TaxID=135651 RepID=G0PIM5_CAEBE|nr:hypothetical protein CAEBREN_10189 [Caenorhabditis brenneri]